MNRTAAFVSLLSLLCASPAYSHHSYADFDTETPFTVTGTLTGVQWTNPHILLFVAEGTRTYRVEWVTITGADRTAVSADRFAPGDTISIVGSRHRDPQVTIVARVQQIDLPAANWHWEPPMGGRSLP